MSISAPNNNAQQAKFVALVSVQIPVLVFSVKTATSVSMENVRQILATINNVPRMKFVPVVNASPIIVGHKALVKAIVSVVKASVSLLHAKA